MKNKVCFLNRKKSSLSPGTGCFSFFFFEKKKECKWFYSILLLLIGLQPGRSLKWRWKAKTGVGIALPFTSLISRLFGFINPASCTQTSQYWSLNPDFISVSLYFISYLSRLQVYSKDFPPWLCACFIACINMLHSIRRYSLRTCRKRMKFK